MKKYFFIVAILSMFVMNLDLKKSSSGNEQTINPVLGDISFTRKFGYEPAATITDETVRIRTHLEYVEDLLRNKRHGDLTPVQLQKRDLLLNLLHQYTGRGIFPRNYDHAGRKPCFIDKDGRICAVGYLVEQTAGRDAADQISKKFKYDDLLAMNDKMLDSWVENSGLTKEECAMIQPTYGNPNWEENYISPSYGAASGILGGVNISLGIINAIKISGGSGDKLLPVLGLAGGAMQLTLGTLGMPPRVSAYGGTNKNKRTLSYINIGIGASTMIVSTVNLLTNKKPQSEKKTSWGIFSFPTQNNNMAMGFSLTRRL